MNHSSDFDRQERAVSIERGQLHATGAAEVDAWRQVHRAILAAPMPELPPGFAARVAHTCADMPDPSRLEKRLLQGTLLALLIAAIVFALPQLIAAAEDLRAVSAHLPTPMLLASGVGVALAATIDRLLTQVGSTRP